MRSVVYRVRGMEDGGRERRLSEAVAAVDGVDLVRVDGPGGAVAVEYDESRVGSGAIAARIAEQGVDVLA